MIEKLQKLQSLYFPEKILAILQTKIISTSIFFIDIWSFIHLVSGFLLGYFIKRWYWILLILIIFEIIENLVLYPNGLAEFEPFLNIIFDIFIAMFGWFLFRRWFN